MTRLDHHDQWLGGGGGDDGDVGGGGRCGLAQNG